MEIEELIKTHTNSSMEEIKRCLGKSKYIVNQDGMCFVADEKMIYFFLVDKSKRNTKQFKEFYNKCYPFMKGKLFFSTDIRNYANRCEVIESYKCKDKGNKLYRWL